MSSTNRTRTVVIGYGRAAVIGLCGGIASLGFRSLTSLLQDRVIPGAHILEGARQLEWWQLLALPVGGAILSALVIRFLVRGGEGTGLTDVMEAVSVKRGASISLRSALSRSLASLCIIASGGSVGREGPIITISSAASSLLARVLRASVRDRGLLLGCGVAAGFAAAYNAPIAGAIFAMEVVLGNFAMQVFGPVVVASVTSMLFTHYVKRGAPIYTFAHGKFELVSLLECGPYLLLGLLAGFAAVLFQYMLRNSGRWFAAIPGPRVGRMVLGGLAIGGVAIAFPEVWGNGYESVNEILHDPRPIGERLGKLSGLHLAGVMLALVLVKMIGTTITVGSGGAGGVFTPTLFVGAALGGAFGELVNTFAPHQTGPVWGYAIVGMGCLVAGTTRAPVMAIVVMFEMTQDYDIVLPLMLGCIASSVVASRLYPHSIYEEKLAERGTLPPQGLEEAMLVTTLVADVMREAPDSVPPSMTYGEIVPLMTSRRASVLYVSDSEHSLLGVIRLHDLIELASMGDMGPGIIAADLMGPVEPVTRDRALAEVFEMFEHTALGELPVVNDPEEELLVGCVTRRDVMAAMHMEILKKKNLRAKFVHPEDEASRTDYVELPRGAELARVALHPMLWGKSMNEAQVRTRYGLTVVNVIRRDAENTEQRVVPGGGFVLEEGDELIVIGDEADLGRWRAEIEGPRG